ncbi:hypothetical protein [Actinokineospora enzanensis]|uniref:hypothetical protein n=1 Tax=Actinokineospora enzanensis TaxID=155975 RepID=UPI0003662933|nr:hypothetical protein [Actinokineospora enzanensis]
MRDFDPADFADRHPNTAAAIGEYFRDGRTVDDLFRVCLAVVVDGAVEAARRSDPRDPAP